RESRRRFPTRQTSSSDRDRPRECLFRSPARDQQDPLSNTPHNFPAPGGHLLSRILIKLLPIDFSLRLMAADLHASRTSFVPIVRRPIAQSRGIAGDAPVRPRESRLPVQCRPFEPPSETGPLRFVELGQGVDYPRPVPHP